MSRDDCNSISPVSRPASICIVVTPVLASPLTMHHCIGAAPRYSGSSEACTFIQPYSGISSISWDNICPNATTMMSSGFMPLIACTASGSLTLRGCSTSMPCSNAHTLTGGGVIFLPRPFGLSGCVTTPTTLTVSINFSRHGTAKSGVPINTVRNLFIKAPPESQSSSRRRLSAISMKSLPSR